MKFTKHFAEVGDAIVEATARYVAEVRAGAFPSAEHAFKPNRPDEVVGDRVDLTKN